MYSPFFIALCLAVITALIVALALIRKKSARKQANAFPVKLLVFTCLLTLTEVLWSGGNGFYIDHRMRQEILVDLDVSAMSSQIAYLDTVIDQALKLAIASGDPKWKATYEDNVRKSNAIVDRLKSLVDGSSNAGNPEIRDLVDRIDKSTDFFLDATEEKALDLAQSHQPDAARAMLDGQEYIIRKQDYSDDIHRLAQTTSASLSQTILSLARAVGYTVYLGLFAMALLPFAWIFSLRSIRIWRAELEKARKKLVENERELYHMIGEIEMSQTEAFKARQAAELASAAKSEFLANMSHELRTPLNSILGMLRLLKEGGLPPEELDLVATAFGSSTNLLDILNDILDLSKIEAGEMKLERIGMDLDYIIDSAVMTLGVIAREKHLPLSRSGDTAFPYVLGDPTRLTRIMNNLIGNALKYTDHGHIDVNATSIQRDATHIDFRCAITDTGIGIAKDKQQQIFEKFVQADNSTTRKYGGTGLGLAITKQLVQLMGGEIGLESQPDVGSTFWFTIPFETTPALYEEQNFRRRKRGGGTLTPDQARILVAEDHPMNQILMTKLLQKFGIKHFTIVENGLDALDHYDHHPCDIILMDCHMPEKNGYDTTLEIREREKGSPIHVPIVAMTANAMIGDREKCLRCGMDDYVSKPINIDEFEEVLGQWIDFGGVAEPAVAAGEAKTADSDILDLSVLRSFTEGDPEIEKELIAVFARQSDINLQSLSDTRTDGGTKTWQAAAHMFKGGAAGIGAQTLTGLCNTAQHFIGTAQEQSLLYEKIVAEYSRVKHELRRAGLLD